MSGKAAEQTAGGNTGDASVSFVSVELSIVRVGVSGVPHLWACRFGLRGGSDLLMQPFSHTLPRTPSAHHERHFPPHRGQPFAA